MDGEPSNPKYILAKYGFFYNHSFNPNQAIVNF